MVKATRYAYGIQQEDVFENVQLEDQKLDDRVTLKHQGCEVDGTISDCVQ